MTFFILHSHLICKILEELLKDPWPVPSDQRAARCTGAALNLAAHLLGACVPGTGARIMAFLGGPSTEGPGAVSCHTFGDFSFSPILKSLFFSHILLEGPMIVHLEEFYSLNLSEA